MKHLEIVSVVAHINESHINFFSPLDLFFSYLEEGPVFHAVLKRGSIRPPPPYCE
jgi:hypothetical protein